MTSFNGNFSRLVIHTVVLRATDEGLITRILLPVSTLNLSRRYVQYPEDFSTKENICGE